MTKENFIRTTTFLTIGSIITPLTTFLQEHRTIKMPFGLDNFLRARGHEISTPLFLYYFGTKAIEFVIDRPPSPMARLAVATSIMALYTAFEFGVLAAMFHMPFVADPQRILDLITVGATLAAAYTLDLALYAGEDQYYASRSRRSRNYRGHFLNRSSVFAGI